MKKQLRMWWHRLLGREYYLFGATDLAGQEIKVCTYYGTHYVGDHCPNMRHPG